MNRIIIDALKVFYIYKNSYVIYTLHLCKLFRQNFKQPNKNIKSKIFYHCYVAVIFINF